MPQYDVHEARTRLSVLLRAVEAGEDVVIARSGRPVARLVPVDAPRERAIGTHDGQGRIAEDFDEFVPPGFGD